MKTLIVALTLLAPQALAHRLYWNNHSSLEMAYMLDQHLLSSFIIGELEAYQVDYYRLSEAASKEMIIALLAPQACPDFLPELWNVAKTLPETQEAPFEVPPDYKSLKVDNPWKIYQDHMINARLGPNVRLNLDENEFYFVVYAGEFSGSYITYKVGRDAIAGDAEGFDALARFARCQRINEVTQ
jgi:hypothetical protein